MQSQTGGEVHQHSCLPPMAKGTSLRLFPNQVREIANREQGGFTLTGVISSSWETSTFEQHFKENLSVEVKGGGIEWGGIQSSVDMISTGNGMRSKEGNKVSGGESSAICHTSEDLLNGVLGFGDKTIGSRGSCVRTTSKELQPRSARTVGKCNGTCELDEIPCSDWMYGQERRQGIDAV